MARRKKKKPLMMLAAGFIMRGVLRNRIIKKEQKRAAAIAKNKGGILPKMPMMSTAIYHALGGKASNASLQRRGARKALRQIAASAKRESAPGKKKHGLVRRGLRAAVQFPVRKLAKKKTT